VDWGGLSKPQQSAAMTPMPSQVSTTTKDTVSSVQLSVPIGMHWNCFKSLIWMAAKRFQHVPLVLIWWSRTIGHSDGH